MIQKLDNGATIITLGKGTVFTGNVYVDDSEVSSGIVFTDKKGAVNTDNSVIIQITDETSVASYIMALIRVVETWSDDSRFKSIIESFKDDLVKMLPFIDENE